VILHAEEESKRCFGGLAVQQKIEDNLPRTPLKAEEASEILGLICDKSLQSTKVVAPPI